MSFTPVGIVIMLVGLACFAFSTKWLFGLTIFFIPFNGTAVINFGEPVTGSSIQPYMFLAVLCVAKSLLIWVLKKKEKIIFRNKYELLFILFFFLFVLIIGLSLIMPVLINGKTSGNVSGQINESIPITYSFKNITQYLYLLQGISFSCFIYCYVKKQAQFTFGIKVFSYSIIFIMAWGMFEYTCKKISFEYPAMIFNNSNNGTVGGYAGLLDSGKPRISSVSAEPSILSQILSVYLPFILVAVESKNYIFSKWKDYVLIGAIVVFTFLTTSSSGILTIFVGFALFIISRKKTLQHRIKSIGYQLAASIICVPIGYMMFQDMIDELFVGKADSYSALERLGTITSGWDNFCEYPILGVGWGSVTVNDFFVRILSNSGSVALVLFILTIYFLLRYNFSGVNKTLMAKYANRASVLAFFVLMFNCEIAGFSFYFGIFWLILGFCMVDKNRLGYIL